METENVKPGEWYVACENVKRADDTPDYDSWRILARGDTREAVADVFTADTLDTEHFLGMSDSERRDFYTALHLCYSDPANDGMAEFVDTMTETRLYRTPAPEADDLD